MKREELERANQIVRRINTLEIAYNACLQGIISAKKEKYSLYVDLPDNLTQEIVPKVREYILQEVAELKS